MKLIRILPVIPYLNALTVLAHIASKGTCKLKTSIAEALHIVSTVNVYALHIFYMSFCGTKTFCVMHLN